MKKIKQLPIFLLLLVLIFSLFAPACNNFDPTVSNTSSSEPPPNSVTPYVPIIDDFKDDRVSVRIKDEYSEVNKPWYPEDFNLDGITISAVIDATYCNDPSKYYSWPFSHQRLILLLSEPSKENVIAAIHQIEVLYFVKRAQPEYIYDSVDCDYSTSDTNYSLQWGLDNINVEKV